MKNCCSSFLRSLSSFTTALICAIAVNALAQNGAVPVVSVHASDPSASESGDPGRFTLFRDGPTNLALNVYCVLEGTAFNGVDYAEIPHWIPVPAGMREVPIAVNPINDALAEGTETVNLRLVYSPTLPPINYQIGSPSNATVFILDNDPPPTNQPPTINIVSPANGDVFVAPANILVLAGVQDPDGNAAAATVEIFSGDHKIGTAQLTDPGPLHAAAFRFYWTNVPPGEYNLSGKVTDEQGASAWSAPVHVSVRGDPPTNQPPTVHISTPTNGAAFTAPANILICAAANDFDGYVATVEFLVGDHSIGIRTNPCPACAGPVNPFCLVWSNVPPGAYVLRVKATDNLGAMSLSEPVQISVREEQPHLPLVTITATDPNAAEPCPSSTPPTVLDTGRFTVHRDSGTNVAFLVSYSISGTASNGVDYAHLSGFVEIPAGHFEADIHVTPVADALAEGPETVVLHLQPIACIAIFPPPPDCYQIGPPSEAAVVIRDCEPRDTNAPPRVFITTPSNGATFPTPAAILICAAAFDPDGYVATVEFFVGDHSLGIRTNLCPLCADPANPFCLVWSNAPPGGYALRVKATDNLGAMSLSEPVNISVREEPPHLPIVTITATDPNATEPCQPLNPPTVLDTGRFTVHRDSGTNVAFHVWYSISGTASNGVDYAALSGLVEIPAGHFEADILVTPLADALAEGPETVVLWLQPLTCGNMFPPPPDCYQIGPPGEAAVVIRDCEHVTNAPPYVRLNSPEEGTVFPAPADVRLVAYAQDPEDGYTVRVEFFSGTHSLGFGTFVPSLCPSPYCPNFALTWSNVPPGSYELTAKATDHNGASATSQLVHIRVGEPQPTNAPPRVYITTPTNGAVFIAPVNILILTDTTDVDGYVWRVEFFGNDIKIGEDSKLFLIAPPDGSHIGYDMVWSNPPPGIYALRGKAFDAAGASAFSEPVRISVIGTNPPPSTNFPPLVTIAAIDPIAAEGTNCWRWYTNMIGWNDTFRTNYSGTNTATFVVRRNGSTDRSLTVAYSIRGSASNRVDYAALPGVVTIPAGERSARITLFPLDDALPECTETVILGLLVSSNSPADYRVGWPGKAAAIIVDNDSPPPGTQRLCDGHFHFSLPAPNNFNYRLECSLDMLHWVPVCTNTVTDFNIRFTEPETADFPARFYRVVPEAAPPME